MYFLKLKVKLYLNISANVDREAARRSRDLEENSADDHLQEQRRWRRQRRRLQRGRGGEGAATAPGGRRGANVAHGRQCVNPHAGTLYKTNQRWMDCEVID